MEKANQVSDMDKTIRQVIRKLQARDADLGLCNAELRRVQAELKVCRHFRLRLNAVSDGTCNMHSCCVEHQNMQGLHKSLVFLLLK